MQFCNLLKVVTKKLSRQIKEVICYKCNSTMSQRRYDLFVRIAIVCVGLLLWNVHAYAEDILKGTEKTLLETLNGTGKKYIYIAEGLMSLMVFIKTKNFMSLIGIVVVAIFFDVMLHMIGT